jgi:hypothetical protein
MAELLVNINPQVVVYNKRHVGIGNLSIKNRHNYQVLHMT